MQWNDIVLIAGLCATVAGGLASLLYTSARLRRWRIGQSTMHLTITRRLESMGELCAVALFSAGFVLLELGNIADQIERGASHQRLAFSLVVGALWLLLFGVALGRLSLRWQLRPEPAGDARVDGAKARA
jgi:hypothetical protein